MICGRCTEIIREPFADLGSSWLWKCIHCHWQAIAPRQFVRGSVTRRGETSTVIEAVGECP